MKNYSSCPICANKPAFSLSFSIKSSGTNEIMDISIDEFLVKVAKQEYLTGELSCCMGCRLFYNSKFFTEQELNEIYNNAYFRLEERIQDFGDFVYNNSEFLSAYSARIYSMVKNAEKKYKREIREIYDIGGRDGFMLKDLAEEKYRCTVLDPIPRESCSPKVKKLNIWSTQVKSDHGVDMVLFCDVLAHCVDIRKEISHLRGVVKDGGLVYLEVPYDIGTVFDWILFGRWRGKNLPIDLTHFAYFSKRSLLRLLNENGFECLEFKFDTIPGGMDVTVLTVLAKKAGGERDSKYKNASFCFDLIGTWYFPRKIMAFFRKLGNLGHKRPYKVAANKEKHVLLEGKR